MLIEGIPTGFELVRIGRYKTGDLYVNEDGEIRAATTTSLCKGYAIVRRIEEPSPGEGWRWVEPGEMLQREDQFFSNAAGCWVVNRAEYFCGVEHKYRRRIGPQLRKIGERLEPCDEMQYPDGVWRFIPPGLRGHVVIGGRYRCG